MGLHIIRGELVVSEIGLILIAVRSKKGRLGALELIHEVLLLLLLFLLERVEDDLDILSLH